MKEVSKKEYHAHFMRRDAVMSTVGNYPYITEWRIRGSQTIIAKHVETDKDENGELIYPPVSRYFIA